MSLPISEQIDANVLTTLAGVTIANGYNFTVAAVERELPSGQNSPADQKIVLLVGDDEEVADDDTPLSHKAWRRPYAAQIYLLKSESDPIPFQQWKNIVRADVEKALMIDVSRGNVAQNTEVHQPQTFMEGTDAAGVFVLFDVIYWTRFDDPYAQ